MKKERPENLTIITEQVKGDVKPIRVERPNERPKPTPNPPKKK